MKKALVFGATGYIGSFLVEWLLADSRYQTVTAVARRDLGIAHPKLNVLIGDYSTLASLKKDLVADDVFLALGTTQKSTPDPKKYYEIDHDYPILAARLALENGAKTVSIVSSVGADEKASGFYLRLKGETERDLIAVGFPHTHVFRPSMILGERNESRPLERLFIHIFRTLGPILAGPLARFKGMEGPDIAKAMIREAQSPVDKVAYFHVPEMLKL